MTLHGAPPCGAWQCNAGACEVACPGCTDGDHDGFGMEATPGACAGPDCDDADDTVHDTVATASCYSGAASTENVGTCRSGTNSCTAGVWTPCQGEVTPSGEACNSEDDDCNGTADDGLADITCGVGACANTQLACMTGNTQTCTPKAQLAANDTTCDSVDDDCDGIVDENCVMCVKVAPTGNDTTAAGNNNTTPFLTIQAAIDYAAGAANRPKIVCAAYAATCGSAAVPYAGAIVMKDGISVNGGYESTLFTQCPGQRTPIVPGVAIGVSFPATVTNPTSLGNVSIDRFTATTTAAVTIDGAKQVTLSHVFVTTAPTVTNSYAVNIINGGQATITQSSLFAGNGTSESIAIRAVGSTVTAINNCQTLDPTTHRCTVGCGQTNPAIRARFTAGTGDSYGVLLENSPNSKVLQNAICGGDATNSAAVRVKTAGTGIEIRGNSVIAFGSTVNSHGVWAEDCGDAAPWIVDNERILAGGSMGTMFVDGIHAVGACHPVIDSNALISGGGEGNAAGANGIYCGRNASGASRCVVLGNRSIQGSQQGFPPTAVGVRCDDGACNRIADNRIDGRGGVDSWGVRMMRTGAVIERNVIAGGCSTMSATGLYAEDAWSRIENNWISGGVCNGAATFAKTSRGLQVVAGPMPGELDVHSNTLVGLGVQAACTSVGLDLDALGGFAAPDGIYRNNIVVAGTCMTRYGLRESTAAADPRVVENCDFAPNANPTALYFDENTTAVTMASGIDALGAVATHADDPSFVAYPTDLHIGANSLCKGVGTATAAPTGDIDGDTRGAPPDIGADEVP